MERLQKVMAERGVASRRKCEEYILAGRVEVNGVVVHNLGTKVDPTKDIIKVDGKVINEQREKIYLLLHKPAGYITSVKDPQNRKTVMELIKDVKERIYPVGRLDYDTEGLLLFTNDGELANRVMHPRYKLDKEYLTLVEGVPNEYILDLLRNGVMLTDGITAPAQVFLDKVENMQRAWMRIIIHEGRNRQVRRMCQAVGHPVLYLKRIRLGPLKLDDLSKGKYRLLSPQEVKQLKEVVELN
jgi:23S rRNA pseudouridine2605 synthase